jgi:hypothetical protein
VIATAGAAVYGRTTYGMMRSYWPTVLNDEKAPEDRRAHARWVEAAEKITFHAPWMPATGTIAICIATPRIFWR